MRGERTKVGELLDLVLQDYRTNGKRSLEQVKLHIENHVRPAFGSKPANLVRKSQVESYKAKRQSEGASPATINRELAALRRAFNLGLEDELIERAPRIKLLPEPDPRETYYEPEEFARFQAVARSIGRLKNYDGELVADITLFSFYSGWRLKEALNLSSDWIKVQERIAVLPKAWSKNKRPRIFPLEGDVWNMVERRLSTTNPDGLLFHRGGKPVKSIRKLCQTICELAELEPKSFHDLRRSAATNLHRAGVEAETGKRITGHRTDALYHQYNVTSLEQLRSAVKKVQSYVDVSIQNKQVSSPPLDSLELPEVMAERAGFEPAPEYTLDLISSQEPVSKCRKLLRYFSSVLEKFTKQGVSVDAIKGRSRGGFSSLGRGKRGRRWNPGTD